MLISLEGITQKSDLPPKKGGECLMVMNIKKGDVSLQTPCFRAFFQMVIS